MYSFVGFLAVAVAVVLGKDGQGAGRGLGVSSSASVCRACVMGSGQKWCTGSIEHGVTEGSCCTSSDGADYCNDQDSKFCSDLTTSDGYQEGLVLCPMSMADCGNTDFLIEHHEQRSMMIRLNIPQTSLCSYRIRGNKGSNTDMKVELLQSEGVQVSLVHKTSSKKITFKSLLAKGGSLTLSFGTSKEIFVVVEPQAAVNLFHMAFTAEDNGFDTGLSTWAILGITAACTVCCGGIILGGIYIYSKHFLSSKGRLLHPIPPATNLTPQNQPNHPIPTPSDPNFHLQNPPIPTENVER
ncbi:unnamed protein product [Moneuplotes crassus]|uniref:CUB domain-containing protein n=1 Tax=Euplotes crassus TaxID=5936 RepID=A0AAD1XA60_EUPCR|nr:unnamed protein product [Moneuplotes crassus]